MYVRVCKSMHFVPPDDREHTVVGLLCSDFEIYLHLPI